MASPSSPTVAGFLAWIRAIMQIGTGVLPDDSPYVPFAYNVAMNTTNRALCKVPNLNRGLPSIYALAVYNLGGDRIINYAPDLPDAPVYKNGLPFFAYMRSSLDINSFVGGVIQSTSDEGTSESMVVPDAFKNLTIGDLQLLKTPWGRQYLAFAQDYGPAVWGLS